MRAFPSDGLLFFSKHEGTSPADCVGKKSGESYEQKGKYEIAISGYEEGNLVMKGNRCIRQITVVILKSVIFLPKA